MGVADRIIQHAERLTTAERRVAAVMADEPDTVAFGTVALIARKAATSGPTVVRFAVKLGYAGFVELQADVQRELSLLLGPARERIRQQPPADLLARVAAVEEHNVRKTLSSIPPAQFDAVVARLADTARGVWVLPGDVTLPVGATLAERLAQLRDGVALVGGSQVVAARALARLAPGDTLVAVDIRRYESWLVELARWAVGAGAVLIAISDGPLSPLVTAAAQTLTMSAEGVGPFDSMTAGIALANALVAGVAARVRADATPRLDRIEAAWNATGALVQDPTGAVRQPPGPAGRLGGDTDGQEPAADGAARREGSARQAAYRDRGKRNGVHPSTLAGVAPLDHLQPVEQAVDGTEG